MPVRYLLSDIEGTTTSVSFVYDVLFPYFLEYLPELQTQLAQPFVKEQLTRVQETIWQEETRTIAPREALAVLEKWTRDDRKHPALKALQGYVWENGYKNGALKGHLYPDVLPALERWKKQGLQLGIYSSGSVQAQKLLFGYSQQGDLTPFFDHYFDTAVGAKREVNSYKNIQHALGIAAEDILFLSDIEAELDAAQQAGFQTVQLVRPGTAAGSRHPHAIDFAQILP